MYLPVSVYLPIFSLRMKVDVINAYGIGLAQLGRVLPLRVRVVAEVADLGRELFAPGGTKHGRLPEDCAWNRQRIFGNRPVGFREDIHADGLPGFAADAVIAKRLWGSSIWGAAPG